MNARRNAALAAATVTALGAVLSLSACNTDTKTGASGGPASAASSGTAATAGTSGGSSQTSSSSTGTTTTGTTTGTTTSNGKSTTTGGSGTTGGSHASSDSYAYTHPCSAQNLSINVVTRSGAATQRVVQVRNNGANACGLSYYPLVSLGNSRSADHSQDVKPLIPSGLGGAPAYPLYAGRTAYAVIDLDPSGATSGTAAGIDELDVLADGDHMANADTRNFPLGSGAHVLKPKLGLYESTVSAATDSMKSADTQS